jgi:hypothetical protein
VAQPLTKIKITGSDAIVILFKIVRIVVNSFNCKENRDNKVIDKLLVWNFFYHNINREKEDVWEISPAYQKELNKT